MNWFSGINSHNKESYLNYIKMYKVAVITAKQTTPNIKPYLIFDGEDDEHIEYLLNIGVNIIKHKVSFSKELTDHYKEDTTALGAFLRIDIPLICDYLKITDDYILYTDNDVLFLKDVTELNSLTPKYFMCAGEFHPFFTPTNMNSGVMWINWKQMLSDHNDFVTFIKNNFSNFQVYDQDALKMYYGDKIESLDPLYNYKPYWGDNNNIKVVHFHGPKPTFTFEQIKNFPYPQLLTPFYYELKNRFGNIINKI